MTFSVEIPPPPSVNTAFVNVKGRGRVKSKEYTAWRNSVGQLIALKVRTKVCGPFAVWINLPWNLKGDIDNRIKGVVDALVSSGRVDDDRFMDELHVKRTAPTSMAVVMVAPLHASVGAREAAA